VEEAGVGPRAVVGVDGAGKRRLARDRAVGPRAWFGFGFGFGFGLGLGFGFGLAGGVMESEVRVRVWVSRGRDGEGGLLLALRPLARGAGDGLAWG
jgi:hypothetical protein